MKFNFSGSSDLRTRVALNESNLLLAISFYHILINYQVKRSDQDRTGYSSSLSHCRNDSSLKRRVSWLWLISSQVRIPAEGEPKFAKRPDSSPPPQKHGKNSDLVLLNVTMVKNEWRSFERKTRDFKDPPNIKALRWIDVQNLGCLLQFKLLELFKLLRPELNVMKPF